MSHCHTCKFATWHYTPSGRVSKVTPGSCTWTKTVSLPQSGCHTNKGTYTFNGGSIWHKDSIKCATYGKKGSVT